MTSRQFDDVASVCDGDLLAAIEAHHIVAGAKIDVEAHYVTWEIAKQRMLFTYLSRRHARKSDTPQPAMAALKGIAREQNAILRHPAMRKKGMAGEQNGWFPAWELPEADFSVPGGRYYSPMPPLEIGHNAWRYVVLGPVWHDDRHGRYTTWSEKGLYPARHWLAEEGTHTSLAEYA